MEDRNVTKLVNTFLYSKDEELKNDAVIELEYLMEKNNPEAWLEYAFLILEDELYGELNETNIEYATKALFIATTFGSTKVHNRLGVSLFEMGKYESAAAAFIDGIEEDNNSDARSNLGILYLNGLGVEHDEKKAISLLKEAANLGNSQAMFKLANCYYHGIGVESDYRLELDWYIKSAEAGSKDACLRLGQKYKWGTRVEKSNTKSKKWYLEAIRLYEEEVSLGEIPSIYKIAEIHLEKLDDPKKAISWYEKSANLGEAEAMYSIGLLYDTDYLGDLDKAIQWYEKSLEHGFVDATINLYFIYKFEKNDIDLALKWLIKGTQLGSTEAYLSIADHYKNENDYKQAAEWYVKLSEIEGFEAKAINELAELYENFEQYNLAIKYYKKLSDFDDYQEKGKLGIGKVYEKVNDYDSAKIYYQELVAMDSADGMIALGNLYINGHGFEKDLNKAEELYQLAVRAGAYYANEKLFELKLLKIIMDNPGLIQTSLYEHFPSKHDYQIRNILYYMDKNDMINRVKKGSTYQIYID